MKVGLALAELSVVACRRLGTMTFGKRTMREVGFVWNWLLDGRNRSFAITTNTTKEAPLGWTCVGILRLIRIAGSRKGSTVRSCLMRSGMGICGLL